MGQEIQEYAVTRTAATSKADDLIDWNATDDTGTTYASSKMTRTELFLLINANITNYYNADGAIPAIRTLNMNGFSSVFQNGTIINKANLADVGYLLQNSLGVEKGSLGYDVGLDSATLELKNAAGTYFSANNGNASISGRFTVGTKSELSTQSNIALWGYTGHNLSNYALLQDSTGLTAVNSAANKKIEFRIGNAVKCTVVGNELQGNGGLGMKYSLFNGVEKHGLGFQQDLFQIINEIDTVDFTFGIGTSSSLNRLMTIKGTGNVGIGTITPTSALDLPASTLGAATLRLRDGVAPTSPNDGEIWQDGTNLKIQIGGITKTVTLT